MTRRTIQMEAALAERVERLERLRYEGHAISKDGCLVLAVFHDATTGQTCEIRPGDTIGQAVNAMEEKRRKGHDCDN